MNTATNPARAPKVYVQVKVEFTEDGRMLPRALTWEDGFEYPIDRVKDVRPAHAARAGGFGVRYTILVEGRVRYLFFEHSVDPTSQNIGRWFLERKE